MRKKLINLFSWLTAVLVFLIPSNLFFVVNESIGYSNGIRVDYLLPKVFASDGIILVLIILGYVLERKKVHKIIEKIDKIIVFGMLLLITAQLFSPLWMVSFGSMLKLAEYTALALVIHTSRQHLSKKLLSTAILATIIVQCIFASYQFQLQHSLSPYWLFGESELTTSMSGLAKGNFDGEERLLAYGTTSHPNVLAGTIVLLSLVLLLINQKNKTYMYVLIPVIILLFLTQSWSATIALFLGLIVFFYKKKLSQQLVVFLASLVLVTPFLLWIVTDAFPILSVVRRTELFLATLSMIQTHPVTGVGLGNFTAVLEQYSVSKELVRFIQPVHNSLWLFLAESGIIGATVLLYTIKNISSQVHVHPIVIALIPILSLDHYLTTSHTGIIVFLLVMLVATDTDLTE